ncbi:hypothetical protein GCK32_009261 [Trichostrongylus colubriformis]|uniref:Uncharacterized protein n=1 Tax=Trichostrongylus colubriformis TaxID=6319 RepID=A0AAN8J3B8_TRICO
MELRKGFDLANVDQSKKQGELQEHVNNSVLSKQIRVLFMPNKDRCSVKDLVKKFLKEVVKYDVAEDITPLSWYKPAGTNGSTSSFRAEMSYSFWDHFVTKGRLNLAEYNRKHKSEIKIIRNQSNRHSDMENLSLYLRKRIREYCVEHDLAVPDVIVKGSYLIIKNKKNSNIMRFKSTLLSIILGWDYSDWHGSPIKTLLTPSELKSYEDGNIRWGSLKMESFSQLSSDVEKQGSSHHSENQDSSKMKSRKRDSNSQDSYVQKKARSEDHKRSF